MASAQCCKPVEKTCSQGQQQNHSLGQKVSEMVGSVFKKDQTHCSGQTTISSGTNNGHGKAKNHTTCNRQEGQGHAHELSGTATCDTNCNRKTRRHNGEHKRRGLLQKIKDGISGNSDSDSSCSESDSDDEKCGRKKN
ncbi:uncharacterized protein LOC8287754 [Ricinus communis]|uniref:Uncharacterized protein n=1 Tax=Ricinus communis TaxID=3988 RepID=B9RCQ9_RICCO|nr:uncharacterized protein LOC8287754 [Ricinus communis]EEF51330.1 conserved hypothetical protein [Ricinus communis]|eukprot:XP_002509943.1 uncharacterized protein LOC8287754 [Ricinus communis]